MTAEKKKEILEKTIIKHLPKAFIGYGQQGFMCQVHYPELCKIIDDYEQFIVESACKKQREICADYLSTKIVYGYDIKIHFYDLPNRPATYWMAMPPLPKP